MPRAKKANSNSAKKQRSTTGRRPAPPRGPVEPRKAAAGTGRAPDAPLTRREVKDAQRLKEIEAQQKALEAERQRLIPRVAAREPPTLGIRDFVGKRRGFTYHTWFKAVGFMDRRGKNEDISQLLDESIEFEEGSIPSAFISHGITGRVRWDGIRGREELINELNSQADWAPMDFRDVYPRWEYTYRIVESIGNVPVAFYEVRDSSRRR